MSFAFLLLALVGLVLVVGTVVTVAGLRNAPEGYEDENGFQVLPHSEESTALHHDPVHAGGLELAA